MSFLPLPSPGLRKLLLVLLASVFGSACQRAPAKGPALNGTATRSSLGGVRSFFEIRGTGDRNNPLRWRLEETCEDDTLLVQFQFRYAASSIDTPDQDEGEFFVLWLDETDGGDRSTHSGGVPNVGVHVNEGENRFMARFASGDREVFTERALQGDVEYSIVAQLEAEPVQPPGDSPGSRQFRWLSLWVDPDLTEFSRPHATVVSPKGPERVNWIGFSTGRKTEPNDRIAVSQVRVAASWEELFGIPPATGVPDPAAGPDDLATAAHAKRRRPGTVSFADQVFPILRDHCFDCHAGAGAEAGVRLDVLDEILNCLQPGAATNSRLIELVTADDSASRMPPVDAGDPLTDADVTILESWINAGVDWDEALLPTPIPESEHWAFQPIERPDVPETDAAEWIRTPVDAFVARRHQQLGITPAKPASLETLRRRIALDLTGLPAHEVAPETKPTDDLHKQLDDLIEQLLGSPAYGERWGRHWLDVARWAESNGHQHNRLRPHAWRYRDYVVRSFKENKPFDQFLAEQIAGDELPYSEEALVATGFLAAARYSGNELDKQIQRNDILVDVANTTAEAFLGVTMGCAQCHTHKFDPISIRDYYRFQAFFNRGQPGNIVLEEATEQASEAQQLVQWRWRIFDDAHQRLVESRRARDYPEPVLVLPKSVYQSLAGSQRESFQQIEAMLIAMPQTWGWYSPATSPHELPIAPHEMRWPLPSHPQKIASQKTYLHPRGDVKSAGPEVEPGWPAVFGPTNIDPARPRTGLAHWMTSTDNPLTARVWVNRIWQWHFGRGLVETSGDFGTQGTPPTHPQLLDWLAAELVDSGWDTNHIHRLIMHSHTYRQAAKWEAWGSSPAASKSAEERIDSLSHPAEVDPSNKTLWHWTPRRMEAEALRDAMLSVAGILDRKTGGPSLEPDRDAVAPRRSLYLQQARDRLPHQQDLFDGPNAVTSCSRRRTSTVPLQPLYLMNSPFAQTAAEAFADRLRERSDEATEQIRQAIWLTLERAPSEAELARLSEFRQQGSLEALCLALLNLNEFAYIP